MTKPIKVTKKLLRAQQRRSSPKPNVGNNRLLNMVVEAIINRALEDELRKLTRYERPEWQAWRRKP